MAHVFNRPMLATEHTEFDTGAETLALGLAARCGLPLAVLLPLVSNSEYEALAPELATRTESEAAAKLAELKALAAQAGVTIETRVRRGPEAYLEIVDGAREHGADLIIIRRRGKRGLLANLLIGEMVRNVVAHSPCSVLVVPRGARMWSRRVLVAVDPHTTDMSPVAHAAAVAAECGLPLAVVCVTPPAADAMQLAEKALQQAWSAARGAGVPVDAMVRIGRPHEQIVATARELGADLLVIGRRGDDSLSRAWLGGVAQKVIGLSELPVLVSVAVTPAKGDGHE